MEVFTVSDLKELLSVSHQPCISMYMPTHLKGSQVRQDPIRFRNLIRKTEKTLLNAGVGSRKTESLLKPCHRLLEDASFWREQRQGLAVFASASFFKLYRTSIRFKEFAVVTDRFHTKPIIELLGGNSRFFVLGLSQKGVRLFEASSQSINEVDVGDLPDELLAGLRAKDSAKELQMVTVRSRGKGKGDVVRFGTGSGETDTKKLLQKYFRAVDKSIRKALKGEKAPLLLAAVDYLVPLYRAVNTYPNLLEASVSGNPNNLTAAELHGKSLRIVRPLFSSFLEAARNRYKELATLNSEQASSDLKTILGASFSGRVDILFASIGFRIWGTYDPQTSAIAISPKPRLGYVDLLDLASAYTLINGGTVHALDPRKMPDRSPISAIYRY